VRSPTDGTRKDLPTTKRSTMSEPSSSVPDEIADAEVEDSSSEESAAEESEGAASSTEDSTSEDAPSTVELDIDQDKVDAWDEVKGDYQVEGDDSAGAEADSGQS
jgi:hypothetical protein